MNAGLNLSRNWTVESGTSHSRVQTQKLPFRQETTKGADSQASGETFTLSSPQEEVAYKPQASTAGEANAASGFSALDAADRKEARRIMKDLNKKARLFARDDQNQLVRIAPGTAKELLDSGNSVEVVTAVGNEVSSSGRSANASYVDGHFFCADDVFRSQSSSSRRTERVEYTSSPISEWDSVLWMDDEDAKGVPGTPVLPGSGQSVEISREWESKWSKSSEEHSFFRNTDSRNSSGYSKLSNRAEG